MAPIAQKKPLITLTTDFGLQDPFVGVMKGVIAGICPAAQVIDITHAVEAFSVLDGALAIWQAWRYFPAETVHVMVVDPGVGSERRAILTRIGEHWFVAPDNGVLTLVERDALREGGTVQSWQIVNPDFMLPKQSTTFHGRDIFAPAAAHLAVQIERGKVSPEMFGPEIKNRIRLEIAEPIRHPDGSIEGVILKSDKFGNLLTNIPAKDAPDIGKGSVMEIGGRKITQFAKYYAEVEPGELFVIAGSSGLLEVAMNRGSAKEEMGVGTGIQFRLLRA